LDVKKKRYTPTNSAAPPSPLSGAAGATGSPSAMCGSMSFSTNQKPKPEPGMPPPTQPPDEKPPTVN
jgi:hypothetical protein